MRHYTIPCTDVQMTFTCSQCLCTSMPVGEEGKSQKEARIGKKRIF